MVRLSPSEEDALQGMPPKFDMKAARKLCSNPSNLRIEYSDRISMEKDVYESLAARANTLPAALDEIVRWKEIALPVALDEIVRWKEIALRQAKRSVGFKQAARRHRGTIDAQAKRIAELEGLPREGLFGKYRICKADGSPIDPKADYFVLRLDTDPIARRAALEYSYYLASHHEDRKLAKDLQDRVAKYDPKLEDCISLRYVGLQKSDLVLRCEAHAKQVDALKAAMLREIDHSIGCYDESYCILRELVPEVDWP